MTWWETPEWRAYEQVCEIKVPRTAELATATWLTQVINLAPPETYLWQSVRHSYKTLIRRHELSVQHVDPVQAGSFSVNIARRMHNTRARRETRPKASWEIMGVWAIEGKADYWVIHDSIENPIGYIFVVSYEGWNYYHSGVSTERNITHALLWTAIAACKRNGDQEFEVGWLGRPGDSAKDKSISFFKTGFGGSPRPANYLKETPRA